MNIPLFFTFAHIQIKGDNQHVFLIWQKLQCWLFGGHCQCSQLHTFVRKWCIEFDLDIQNFYLIHHFDTIFLKLLDRKLHCDEAQIPVELSKQTTVSQLARVLPLARKQSECALGIGSMFLRCRYSAGWTKGKGNLLSPWWVRKKLLKCLSASFIINVDCFLAFSSGSCIHLWDLCTEFHR